MEKKQYLENIKIQETPEQIALKRQIEWVLSFFDEEKPNGTEQKTLFSEMLNKGNNIFDDMTISEQEGKQIIHIRTSSSIIDLIPEGNNFGASIVREKQTGNIGMFLLPQEGDLLKLEIDPEDTAMMFNEGSYFIYKKNGEMKIEAFGAKSKCVLNSKQGETFEVSDITAEEIEILNQEINNIQEHVIAGVIEKCNNDLDKVADTLLSFGLVSQKCAIIMKKMNGNVNLL